MRRDLTRLLDEATSTTDSREELEAKIAEFDKRIQELRASEAGTDDAEKKKSISVTARVLESRKLERHAMLEVLKLRADAQYGGKSHLPDCPTTFREQLILTAHHVHHWLSASYILKQRLYFGSTAKI